MVLGERRTLGGTRVDRPRRAMKLILNRILSPVSPSFCKVS